MKFLRQMDNVLWCLEIPSKWWEEVMVLHESQFLEWGNKLCILKIFNFFLFKKYLSFKNFAFRTMQDLSMGMISSFVFWVG